MARKLPVDYFSGFQEFPDSAVGPAPPPNNYNFSTFFLGGWQETITTSGPGSSSSGGANYYYFGGRAKRLPQTNLVAKKSFP